MNDSPAPATRPVSYMTIADVARLLRERHGITVTPNTAAGWIQRNTATHPCPEPDIRLGLNIKKPVPGWHPGRLGEWKAWYDTRPGHGAGGGRKPAQPPA